MAGYERIGTRVAATRKTRGWTSRELARRANVSYSLLTKVESGAAAASPAFIGAVARALRVDVPRITGQPYEAPVPNSSASTQWSAIPSTSSPAPNHDPAKNSAPSPP